MERVADAFGDALEAIVLFLPRALGFLLILLVGLFIAKMLEKAVVAILDRVRFSRVLNRAGVGGALEGSSWSASEIVGRIVFLIGGLFTLIFAFGVWGPNPISDLLEGIVDWLPNAFVAVLIVLVAMTVARALRDLIRNALSGVGYGEWLAQAGFWFVAVTGVIAALNQVGIAVIVTSSILIAFLAAIVGVVIVGVGGGLVRPMEDRWRRMLERGEDEAAYISAVASQNLAAEEEVMVDTDPSYIDPTSGEYHAPPEEGMNGMNGMNDVPPEDLPPRV